MDGRTPPTDETLDSIPWDALLTARPSDRRRWALTAVAGVALLVAAVVVSRVLWPAEAPRRLPAEVAVASSIATTSPTVATVVAVPAVDVPSEADLMAVDTEAVETAVIGRAAWFLREYFTVGSGERPPLGDLGWAVEEPVRSYVESVDAVGLERLGPDRFRVTAVVRLLVDPDGRGYHRSSPWTVSVPVDLREDGPEVVDRPRPERAVTPLVAVHDLGASSEAPAAVVEAAVELFSTWGATDASTFVVSRRDNLWRVEGSVIDDTGVPWPMAAWFDAAGSPAG